MPALARAARHLERDHVGAKALVALAQRLLVQLDLLVHGRGQVGRDRAQGRVVGDLRRRREGAGVSTRARPRSHGVREVRAPRREGRARSRRTGMMRTCPPPGTGLESVEHSWPLGSVTYVSEPMLVMRCLVTLGFDRQNQHSSAAGEGGRRGGRVSARSRGARASRAKHEVNEKERNEEKMKGERRRASRRTADRLLRTPARPRPALRRPLSVARLALGALLDPVALVAADVARVVVAAGGRRGRVSASPCRLSPRAVPSA